MHPVQICKKKLRKLSLIKLQGISVSYEVSAPSYEKRSFLDSRKKD